MLIAGQLSFLRLNVICDDLVSFTFIFHFCSQFCIGEEVFLEIS